MRNRDKRRARRDKERLRDATTGVAGVMVEAFADLGNALDELERLGPLHPLAPCIAGLDQLLVHIQTEPLSADEIDSTLRELHVIQRGIDHQTLRISDPEAFAEADTRITRCIEALEHQREKAN